MRLDQDADDAILDLTSSEARALHALLCSFGYRRRGDVIAIPSAFLDRVRWREMLPSRIDQQARE
jgi:hypothetical protein